ncbi:PTS system mannose/fructose/sorbose family transporter subunit IID [uncultured Lactobacillus sp.]|uniref:PTS system mannose/fructose/sorbose family transporter subunit IID n=1 Tax=uncultured Lactobacillus sp. TaxID=153152 RepID=UPI00164FC2EA|nr:PTS system mannose/fructose/sorbose family transporter subunit IID [uncultured Lactobacillus sp.]MBC6370990.1 PTS system mannose/fructose/sorbose family transporter subunit IID [Lactobacillus kullabergensis]MCT6890007.1 PTS system mannose/fructose/sorbose family transporter subunit IID [Lactobacillus sp.]
MSDSTKSEVVKKKKLTKRDLMRVFLLWETTSESCLSYERLMSLGFCHAMVPVINRLYDTKEERAEALKRHLVFFNTENNWGAFIPGMICSMEEDHANGGAVSGEAINAIKIGLMGPLAGIGDTITQGLVKTIALAVGVDLATGGKLAGPIVYALIYGIYLIVLGFTTFTQGYNLGQKVLTKITDKSVMKKLTNSLSILGLVIAGAMTVNNVKITTPLKIVAGSSKIVVQDLLNSILPGMLSVLAVVICFVLLRKNVSVFKIMIGLFVVAMLCSFIGVL